MAGEFLRSFAKFFTNLTTPQRQEIERALADLQNSKEITSLDESLRLLKRKPDQRLPIPVLIVSPTVRGAIIEWEALPDQRINFYEIEISSASNFATFNTVTTFGLNIVIDGLSATRFVRVRGVRRNGTTTPYSDPTTVSPNIFDIKSHAAEAFYVRVEGSTVNLLLGGAGTDLEYVPINPDGNSMVWGFLTGYGDPAVAMFGAGKITASVFVKILNGVGTEISEEEFLRVSLGEHFNSLSIGPFHVEHPILGYTIQIRLVIQDQTVTETGAARAEDSTEITWAHLNVLEIGST